MNVLIFLLSTTPIPNPVNSNPPDVPWLAPTFALIGSGIIAIFGTVSLVVGKRQDRKNKKLEQAGEAQIAAQPKVTDGWQEVRDARDEATDYYRLYRTFEELFYTVFSALRHLVRSTRDVHPEQKFDQDIIDALAIVPPDPTKSQKK